MTVRDRDFRAYAKGTKAVESLTAIAREKEVTRRFLIGAACLLFITAAHVVRC